MKIQKLVLGSGNKAKVTEWTNFLSKDLVVVSIAELGTFPEPEETGDTLLDNAKLKASYYAKLTKEYTFAEDGGFAIEALNGFPGVRSKRILEGGKEGTDLQIVQTILKRMEGLKGPQRKASQKVAVALSDPKGNIIYEDQGEISGIVPEKAPQNLISGYPYRSLLYLDAVNKLFVDLTEEEHTKLNHKKEIAKKIIKFLQDYD